MADDQDATSRSRGMDWGVIIRNALIGVAVCSLVYAYLKTSAEYDVVPLPEARVRVDVDPAIYDQYTGLYELRPRFNLAVTRQEGRLFAQATGQVRVELPDLQMWSI